MNTILTDDEIYGMYSEPSSDAEMVAFAREVEAAVLAKLRKQEPVAWLDVSKRGFVRTAWLSKPTADQIAVAEHDGDTIIPLVPYAAPQPAVVPQGWKLVPVEPTDKMVQAAHHLDLSYMPGQEGADRAAIYRAMLDAAPEAPALPAEVREAIKVAREALAEEKRVRLLGQEPDVHWESMRDIRRACYAATDAALARLDALGGGE